MEISLAVAVALILSAILSYELKLSSAIIEVLAGIALGVLIVDIHEATWLAYLSNIGVLALMFVAGFELRIRALRKTWVPSVSIGVSSFLVPLTGIFCFMRWGLEFDVLPAALVSVGMSTTSLALVYHLMKEQGVLSSQEGQIMFGAASIVDILSMVCLALLLGEIGMGTLLFGIIFVAAIFTIPRFANWVFKRYPNSLSEPELRFLMVVIVGMSFMAESVGHVHPALVAFTLGVFMSRFIERNKEVKNKLMALVFSFFAPIFFLQAGTKIDLGDLTYEYFAVFAGIFVLATGLKYIGTYIPSRFFIKGWGYYAGMVFNYRLSFGIITANVGLEKGLIDSGMYAVIMLVIVSSAALPSLFLRGKTKKDSLSKPEQGSAGSKAHETCIASE